MSLISRVNSSLFRDQVRHWNAAEKFEWLRAFVHIGVLHIRGHEHHRPGFYTVPLTIDHDASFPLKDEIFMFEGMGMPGCVPPGHYLDKP